MLMTLEMRQRDEDIGVHHGAADACGLAVFAAHDRDLDIVRALEPVGDDDVTAGGERGIAVEIVGAQERQIAELAEMQLDGDEFAVKIDL